MTTQSAREKSWDEYSRKIGGKYGEYTFNAGYDARDAELEALKAELRQQQFNNKHNLSIGQKVSDEIETLKAELKLSKEIGRNLANANHDYSQRVAELEEVRAFYADEKNWDDRIVRDSDGEKTRFHDCCGGRRARAAKAKES